MQLLSDDETTMIPGRTGELSSYSGASSRTKYCRGAFDFIIKLRLRGTANMNRVCSCAAYETHSNYFVCSKMILRQSHEGGCDILWSSDGPWTMMFLRTDDINRLTHESDKEQEKTVLSVRSTTSDSFVVSFAFFVFAGFCGRVKEEKIIISGLILKGIGRESITVKRPYSAIEIPGFIIGPVLGYYWLPQFRQTTDAIFGTGNDRYKIVVFRLVRNIGVTGNSAKQVFAPAAIALAILRHESLPSLSSNNNYIIMVTIISMLLYNYCQYYYIIMVICNYTVKNKILILETYKNHPVIQKRLEEGMLKFNPNQISVERDRLRERDRLARAAMSVQAEQAAAGSGPDMRHHHHHHNHAHHHSNIHLSTHDALSLFRAPYSPSRSAPSVARYRYGASPEARRWRHFGTQAICAGGNKDAVRAAKEGRYCASVELDGARIVAAMLSGTVHIYYRD
ncbi:hypothetical protein ALC57_10699 [Trachymyrmex cornetzi]|uniref:Uncharacterized protein n=1 Tax=Trachymyrmex cornetzi TaxID=471704 RepID=A0A151J3I7_9HYME|nr:hypothetical protein ALC57_10699 [Trachymyrmex cornetzi]